MFEEYKLLILDVSLKLLGITINLNCEEGMVELVAVLCGDKVHLTPWVLFGVRRMDFVVRKYSS